MLNLKTIKRFWGYINKTDSCWIWEGPKNEKGYGNFNVKYQRQYAHRVSYEINIGKIPKGLVIDHLCKNTSCVNPNHLEVVTQRENILRGESIFAKQARQTYCKRGHKLIENNIYIYGNHRRCKICDLNRYYQRVGRPVILSIC